MVSRREAAGMGGVALVVVGVAWVVGDRAVVDGPRVSPFNPNVCRADDVAIGTVATCDPRDDGDTDVTFTKIGRAHGTRGSPLRARMHRRPGQGSWGPLQCDTRTYVIALWRIGTTDTSWLLDIDVVDPTHALPDDEVLHTRWTHLCATSSGGVPADATLGLAELLGLRGVGS